MSEARNSARHPAAALAWGLFFIIAAMVSGCGGEQEPTQPPPTGFAFFDIGTDTTLTASVRKNLTAQLGSEAITGRGLIDLEVNYPGFLKDHFQPLDRLNQTLNYPPMERVEHDITRLMFRYARQKGQPFYYVELVFSNQSGKPLFFKVFAKTDGSALIDQLKQKYSEPQTVTWRETEGKTFYWVKDRDVLMMSVAPNRIGEPEYRIAIYYAGNLEEMIETEKRAAELREEALKRAGEKAF